MSPPYTPSECCTWNWLAQKTNTNRIISSQGLIIIRSRRNAFIIRNQNKRKLSLYLVAKFRKLQCKLTSVAGRYNSLTLQVSTESFTDPPGTQNWFETQLDAYRRLL